MTEFSVGDLAWCILRTEPNREWMAENALRGHRIEVKLPYFLEFRVFRGQPRSVRKALLHGYLFALLPPQGGYQWDVVRSVGGLMKMNPSPAIRINGKIVFLTDEQVSWWMDLAQEMRTPKPKEDKFKIGQNVIATEGLMEGKFGRIDRMDGAGRVRVLFDMLSGKVPVSIEEKDIQAA